ncbi:hypothetical protein EVAR_69929_1 [Eumeta japonica]|uniref:Uncharacterized protein n=1 Tax=Eumeta variegata TaxID=151549 RepID=A0A4C2A4C3_EUMVA|nr:hypothetical protein EVAR_69929_1 [Eumeta japonica]
MDRSHSKSKKNRAPRYGEKEKPLSLHQDLKTIKENLKIKEMLKIVKINSSFRLKGPRGTKVITDNLSDIADNNLILESSTRNNVMDAPSVNEVYDTGSYSDNDSVLEQMYANTDEDNVCENYEIINPIASNEDSLQITTSNDNENETLVENYGESDDTVDCLKSQLHVPEEAIPEHSERDATSTLPRVKSQLSCERSRKMSLDQTILNRRKSWSQSELDLHSVGKSPLERKSSFFRKKLDNFFKNTSEIFKKQSGSVKSEKVSRKGSMSFSLQSLNEKNLFPSDMILQTKTEDTKSGDSINKLDLPSNLGCSASSLPGSEISQRSFLDSQISLVESQSSQPSYGDTQSSQSNLSTSQPFVDVASSSMNSLNDLKDPLASSRAYSVSSGLDTVHKPRSRRLASRTNRITWLANEGLAEYMRRRVEIEMNRKANNMSLSYQDVNYIPEAQSTSASTTRLDARGRRLSYQRAVSGEDPVMPHRLSDRRRNRYSPEMEPTVDNVVVRISRKQKQVQAKGFHLCLCNGGNGLHP